MKTGVFVKDFTRNKQTFDELLHDLRYKHLHEFERELGFRLRFDEGYKHRDFEISTILLIYNTLKNRWAKLYYALPNEEIVGFIKKCPSITLEKVVKSLGYDFNKYTTYNRQKYKKHREVA